MPTYDKDGHLFGDAYFNADYFHVGNEAAEKTYINIENEELEIHNLVAPTEDNDAATKKYVDDNAGGGGAPVTTVNLNDLKNGTQQEINEFCSSLAESIDGGTMPVICGTRDNLSYNYYTLANVIRDSGTEEITQINYSSVITGSSGGTVTFVESAGATMTLGNNDDWSFSEGTATLFE